MGRGRLVASRGGREGEGDPHRSVQQFSESQVLIKWQTGKGDRQTNEESRSSVGSLQIEGSAFRNFATGVGKNTTRLSLLSSISCLAFPASSDCTEAYTLSYLGDAAPDRTGSGIHDLEVLPVPKSDTPEQDYFWSGQNRGQHSERPRFRKARSHCGRRFRRAGLRPQAGQKR